MAHLIISPSNPDPRASNSVRLSGGSVRITVSGQAQAGGSLMLQARHPGYLEWQDVRELGLPPSVSPVVDFGSPQEIRIAFRGSVLPEITASLEVLSLR